MLIWKPIPGFERLYEVSDAGHIRSLRSGLMLRPQRSNRDYLRVCLSNRNRQSWRSVHRLVAQAFLPNPQGLPVVRHLDDDKTNNILENLAWGTYADNTQDAMRSGRHPAAKTRARTACKHGHEYVEGSFRIDSHGGRRRRICLICDRRKSREQYRKHAEDRRTYAAARRAAETPEQREARLAYLREYHRARRVSVGPTESDLRAQ